MTKTQTWLLALIALVAQACTPTPEATTSPTTQAIAAENAMMPKAPWSIVFADASGNSFHLLQPSPEATAEFEYTPVTPEVSSSGTYSGGMATAGKLTQSQVQSIWTKMVEMRADTSSHVEQRMMGTGAFRVLDSGVQKDFIVRAGPELDAFMALLEPLRTE